MLYPTTLCSSALLTCLRFGRKVIRVVVGQCQRREDFIIHEDLLYQKSEHFRNQLQPKRKPFVGVPAIETECSICHDQLEPGVKELTCCSLACGVNFHYKCLQRWKASQPDDRNFNCPYCRQPWAEESNKIEVLRLADIKATAFSMWTKWLYYDRVSIEDHETGSDISRPDLNSGIHAYALGIHAKSSEFYKAVLECFSVS
jgi:hypothetical protein